MSVSQVKKKFAEFEQYLGKDTEGLARLKQVKDAVNVLRTTLATTQESMEELTQVKDAARKRADEAEAEATELRLENQRLQGQLQSALTTVRRLREEREYEEPEWEEPSCTTGSAHSGEESLSAGALVDYSGEMLAAMRRLYKYQPRMPGNRPVPPDLVAGGAFDRCVLSDGWSDKALWQLGAIVAMLTVGGRAIMVWDSTRLGDPSPGKKIPTLAAKCVKLFAKWVGLADRGVGSGTVAAADTAIDRSEYLKELVKTSNQKESREQ